MFVFTTCSYILHLLIPNIRGVNLTLHKTTPTSTDIIQSISDRYNYLKNDHASEKCWINNRENNNSLYTWILLIVLISYINIRLTPKILPFQTEERVEYKSIKPPSPSQQEHLPVSLSLPGPSDEDCDDPADWEETLTLISSTIASVWASQSRCGAEGFLPVRAQCKTIGGDDDDAKCNRWVPSKRLYHEDFSNGSHRVYQSQYIKL